MKVNLSVIWQMRTETAISISIDQTDGSISLYRFADKKAELLYSYLFDVFLVIAIIEAVIITVTVYVLKSMVTSRTNPRPKRV